VAGEAAKEAAKEVANDLVTRRKPSGRVLAALLLAGVVWAAWGLVWHPAFQPAPLLRIAAPILALFVGGAFTRLVARLRARVDGEREFDRGGKALFMGFVMVAATLVAWLLVSQAAPATLNALAGHAATEAGVVARRVPPTSDAGCRFRLEVGSASTAGGAVPRPLDECVDEAVWANAASGGPVTLRLVRSAVGAELVGVGSAEGAR
jgi:hypothetical protein